jgi:hypothetical protein
MDNSPAYSAPQANTSRTFNSFRANSVSTDSMPRQSGSSSERNGGVQSHSTPFYNRGGGSSTPSFGGSNPSFERNSGARSYSTPSYNRSSGSRAPSFSRPSGGAASGSFGGGAQRAQERGSAGGGRGRR